MTTTRLSLIQKIRDGEEPAWEKMDLIYRPLIKRWLQNYSVVGADADDLAQEVMSVVFNKMFQFVYSGNAGAFRSWLRHITINCARGFLRSQRLRPKGTGSDEFLKVLDQLEDPESDVARQFNRQHDEHVLQELLKGLANEFTPRTLQAFQQYVIEDKPAGQVAKELEISVDSVYSARSRILRRLQEDARELLGPEFF